MIFAGVYATVSLDKARSLALNAAQLAGEDGEGVILKVMYMVARTAYCYLSPFSVLGLRWFDGHRAGGGHVFFLA